MTYCMICTRTPVLFVCMMEQDQDGLKVEVPLYANAQLYKSLEKVSVQ